MDHFRTIRRERRRCMSVRCEVTNNHKLDPIMQIFSASPSQGGAKELHCTVFGYPYEFVKTYRRQDRKNQSEERSIEA